MWPQEEKGDDTNPEVVLGSCTCSNHPKTFIGVRVFGLFLQHSRAEGMRREIILGLITGMPDVSRCVMYGLCGRASKNSPNQ